MWEFLHTLPSIIMLTCIFIVFLSILFGITMTKNVDRESPAYGGILVAEVLKNHGVKNIFTLVGGHISPILAAAERIGIKVVDTRHEASAVFAADAAARLTGEIGVAAVTAGPGLTNCITAMKTAQMAESPVLLLGGAAAMIQKGRGALQDIDQLSLLKTTCKFCITVKAVKDIVPVLKKAINRALSGVPGPVFVELPLDVLYPYCIVRKELIGKMNTSTILGRIISWYLEYYLNSVFTSAWEPRDMSPLPVETPIPDPNLVEDAATLLVQARRPLILVGSQAMIKKDGIENMRNALLQLGVPTYLGGMARGLLGVGCPIQIQHARSEALKKADLVILAGTKCDFRLKYGRILPKKGKIITVNRDYDQATMNAWYFWNPTLTITGDVASFISSLETFVYGYKGDSKWIAKLQERDVAKEQFILDMSTQSVDYLNPLSVLHELNKLLPDNAILIADGGDFVGSAANILKPRGPLTWLDPGAFGTLGVGGGFAVGAKITCPDAQVWIIYGDGSCGYSIAEFDTFVRHNLPVIALVGNDGGWAQIEREQKAIFGTSVACRLERSPYHLVARGYGAEGISSHPSTLSASEAIQASLIFNAAGRSVLINAFIGRTQFRDGSISV
ncbi:2-hydroxyacyl-CoA lyase 2-like [Hetaerina americana]|uniref:2-hydroxyacyl-CoA lyase 2-like n=1 Tax=Hetaerina americana TaxID=62018 RepID=UPI003A7F2694